MSKQTLTVPIDVVRKLAVITQCLNERPNSISEKIILKIINQIGIIQIDAINVIQRSHYLVLFSRVGQYETSVLDELTYGKRKLIEQWVHVASLITFEDFIEFSPCLLSRRMEELPPRKKKILGDNYLDKLNEIIKKIAKEGPLNTSYFDEINPNKLQWWSKKPYRVAMDVLFRQGYLAVSFRKNFRCYYDLRDKIIPVEIRSNILNFYTWATLKSINAMGAATIDHISDYYRINKKNVSVAIDILLKNNDIVPIEVVGVKTFFYTSFKNLDIIKEISNYKVTFNLTTILSPFDSLIWNRERTKLLFNFAYKSEMYKPLEERNYGYYVLPVIHNGNLIARIDSKFDRKPNTLIINSLIFEPNLKITSFIIKSVTNAINELGAFLKATDIKIIKTEPSLVCNKMKKHLR